MLFGQFSNINIYDKIVSRGKYTKKKGENYGTNLSPTFNKNQDRVPWFGEKTMH